MGFLLAATLLLSASAIAYEILLVRLLSIIHWHHFAWMVISLALLGYGASGSVIALARRRLEPRVETAFAAGALAFSASSVSGFLLAQKLPFNALEVAWNPGQFLYLASMYLLFMVPFFFAGGCIGLALTCRSRSLENVYFFDLLGAGLGASLLIAALYLVEPQQALVLVAGLGLAASVLALSAAPGDGVARPGLRLLQLAGLLLLAWLALPGRIALVPSEFKGLSQALQVIDSRVLERSSSPLGALAVVDSPRVPFRHAPGLSLASRHIPPEQLALFTDADAMSVITRDDGGENHEYLEDMTASAPYRILQRPDVLVLGAGAGQDVLMALHHGASTVTAVELNPQVMHLMRGQFAAYSGRLYDRDEVRAVVAEARGYVRRSGEYFDLIQLGLVDSFAVSGSGVQSLSEGYLYTVEAMQELMERLAPGGILSITRWLNVPPRDGLKLAATLIEAMKRQGETRPGSRLMIIRGWNTLTVLVGNEAFPPGRIDSIRAFAQSHSFDLVWAPGMERSEANRFNRLDRPWFHDGVATLLDDAGAAGFMDRYKFRIDPATDDRPYFFHFFRWRVLPEVLALRERGGAGLIEWGYLVLVATVLQALLAGALLILLPLALARRGRGKTRQRRMGAYFFLLGLAFLFVEMAFIQKFTLFLHHPVYAVAVVLAGFLVFAGLGSASSRSFARLCRKAGTSAVPVAVGGIAVVALGYLLALPPLFSLLSGLGEAGRVLSALALIAPLAFFMGMPFPLGLRRIADTAAEFIPWAWAINGFASVLSAALAVLLAMALGFTAVLSVAVVLYVLAALLYLSDRKQWLRT